MVQVTLFNAAGTQVYIILHPNKIPRVTSYHIWITKDIEYLVVNPATRLFNLFLGILDYGIDFR